MADPLFPIPSPDMLFVYDLRVQPRGASIEVTPDGVPVPVTSLDGSVPVRGYVSTLGRTERPDEVGEVLARAVALVPLETAVEERDTLFVEDTHGGLPRWLQGWWQVTEVRPNPSHIRVLLQRDDRLALV